MELPGRIIKECLAIVEDCSQHMGCVDKQDVMANKYELFGEHGSGQRIIFSPVGSNSIEYLHHSNISW
jgi:hypothetical protein